LRPLPDRIPLHGLHLVIGILLLLFDMRRLDKAILCAAWLRSVAVEAIALAAEVAGFCEWVRRQEVRLARPASFKGAVIELEVLFVVIAVRAVRRFSAPAKLGAFAACLPVACVDCAWVPENTLKSAVVLSALPCCELAKASASPGRRRARHPRIRGAVPGSLPCGSRSRAPPGGLAMTLLASVLREWPDSTTAHPRSPSAGPWCSS
jgi:hypothetical protein